MMKSLKESGLFHSEKKNKTGTLSTGAAWWQAAVLHPQRTQVAQEGHSTSLGSLHACPSLACCQVSTKDQVPLVTLFRAHLKSLLTISLLSKCAENSQVHSLKSCRNHLNQLPLKYCKVFDWVKNLQKEFRFFKDLIFFLNCSGLHEAYRCFP